MISRKNTVSLSNMPVISSSPSSSFTPKDEIEKALYEGVDKGEWVVSKFDKTPPMSTYLLAYANGPFEYIEAEYKSPLSGKVRPLRVYTTKDKIHQVRLCSLYTALCSVMDNARVLIRGGV